MLCDVEIDGLPEAFLSVFYTFFFDDGEESVPVEGSSSLSDIMSLLCL